MFLRLFLFDYLLQFCPDLVLVCAGFDSAIGDPEVLKINHSNEVYNAQHLCPECSIVVNVFNIEVAVKRVELVHVDMFSFLVFSG